MLLVILSILLIVFIEYSLCSCFLNKANMAEAEKLPHIHKIHDEQDCMQSKGPASLVVCFSFQMYVNVSLL